MKYRSPNALKFSRSSAFFLGSLLLCLVWSAKPLHAELLTIDERGGLSGAYLHIDKTPDLVEVRLIIKSGGFDEGDAPDGLAHYLEHLVWLSAANPDGRASAARHKNAQTTGEHTLYIMKGPPAELETYLETVARIFDPPSLDEQFMLEERDVVMREYDYRVSELKTYPIARDLVTQLFGDSPRGRSVIGTPSSIAEMTPKAALDLHARTYVPDNAVLFIIGNTDLATAAPLVEKHLGAIPAGEAPPERTPPPFQERREIVETSVEGAAYNQVVYFKRVQLDPPIASDRLNLRLDLLEAILNSTLEGSLAKPLSYDDFIALRYYLDLAVIGPGDVLLTFEAAPDEGVALQDLLDAFEETLQAIADKGVPKETFERVRKKRLSELDEVKGKRRPAIRLVITQTAYGQEPIDTKTEIERYGETSLAEVNDLVSALAGPGDVAAALIAPDPSD